MKNYRKLVPIVMIVVMVLSWYRLISNKLSVDREYNKYLTEARNYADINVTKYAVENYSKALSVKSSADIYEEVADYYSRQENSYDAWLAWCESFIEQYPRNSKSYDCILQNYMSVNDYSNCYSILDIADKRNISSDYIDSLKSEIEYKYRLDLNSYDEVSVYSNNFCAVRVNDNWGYVDRYGNSKIQKKYKSADAFSGAACAAVIDKNGDAYFIDKTDEKVRATNEKYKQFGILINGIMTARNENGKYSYLDEDFEKLFGDYDNATAINGDIGAVKTGSAWKIINKDGKQVGSTEYEDIIIDEKNIVCRNDRLFVKTGNGYIMVDTSGKQIGSDVYEDAKLFSDDTYAAVKQNGKWFFIDKEGKKHSDNTYNDARSYMNGMAAVLIDGKWGFVDSNEEIKIEPQYYGAKDFNEKGSCFVKVGDKWQLLKLYRLNRED